MIYRSARKKSINEKRRISNQADEQNPIHLLYISNFLAFYYQQEFALVVDEVSFFGGCRKDKLPSRFPMHHQFEHGPRKKRVVLHTAVPFAAIDDDIWEVEIGWIIFPKFS